MECLNISERMLYGNLTQNTTNTKNLHHRKSFFSLSRAQYNTCMAISTKNENEPFQTFQFRKRNFNGFPLNYCKSSENVTNTRFHCDVIVNCNGNETRSYALCNGNEDWLRCQFEFLQKTVNLCDSLLHRYPFHFKAKM